MNFVKNVGKKLDTILADKFAVINTHDDLANELILALSDELPTFFRDGNVIKNGFNPSLDKMRELSNGAIETIARLQEQYINQTAINTLKINGIKTGIATSNSRELVDAFLNSHNANNLFDYIATASEVKSSKPAP